MDSFLLATQVFLNEVFNYLSDSFGWLVKFSYEDSGCVATTDCVVATAVGGVIGLYSANFKTRQSTLSRIIKAKDRWIVSSVNAVVLVTLSVIASPLLRAPQDKREAIISGALFVVLLEAPEVIRKVKQFIHSISSSEES